MNSLLKIVCFCCFIMSFGQNIVAKDIFLFSPKLKKYYSYDFNSKKCICEGVIDGKYILDTACDENNRTVFTLRSGNSISIIHNRNQKSVTLKDSANKKIPEKLTTLAYNAQSKELYAASMQKEENKRIYLFGWNGEKLSFKRELIFMSGQSIPQIYNIRFVSKDILAISNGKKVYFYKVIGGVLKRCNFGITNEIQIDEMGDIHTFAVSKNDSYLYFARGWNYEGKLASNLKVVRFNCKTGAKDIIDLKDHKATRSIVRIMELSKDGKILCLTGNKYNDSKNNKMWVVDFNKKTVVQPEKINSINYPNIFIGVKK